MCVVAATELQEECGLTINAADLIDLTEMAYGDRFPGMFPSPGGSDEFLRLFLFKTKVERSALDEMKDKVCGLVDHGEVITLSIIRFADLWKEAPDAKALAAVALYTQLKADGRL
jgi:ADP-sugar diphosphatase